MTRDELVKEIRYHWHCYVAAGGFDAPSSEVGELTKEGQLHWFKFLLLGRKFLLDYPDKMSILRLIVPKKTIKMLTGE